MTWYHGTARRSDDQGLSTGDVLDPFRSGHRDGSWATSSLLIAREYAEMRAAELDAQWGDESPAVPEIWTVTVHGDIQTPPEEVDPSETYTSGIWLTDEQGEPALVSLDRAGLRVQKLL